MSKPQKGFSPPDFAGQTKTLWCVDGNTTAVLVTNTKGRRSVQEQQLATVGAALAWGLARRAVVIVFPGEVADASLNAVLKPLKPS